MPSLALDDFRILVCSILQTRHQLIRLLQLAPVSSLQEKDVQHLHADVLSVLQRAGYNEDPVPGICSYLPAFSASQSAVFSGPWRVLTQ